jgi:NTP pyrophosphatase (non-canonical NTP hydrolase)
MKWQQFVSESSRTWDEQSDKATREHAMLGMMGELGEIIELHKKSKYNGIPFSTNKLAEEIGDWLWYYARHPEHGSLNRVMQVYETRNFAQIAQIAMAYLCDDQLQEAAIGVLSIAALYDITLEECLVANVAKLKARYPEGFVPGGGVRKSEGTK